MIKNIEKNNILELYLNGRIILVRIIKETKNCFICNEIVNQLEYELKIFHKEKCDMIFNERESTFVKLNLVGWSKLK